MIAISNTVSLDENEITFESIRAQGFGGQEVNKASTAIHLRFDIADSALPNFYKEKLLVLKEQAYYQRGYYCQQITTVPQSGVKQR